MEYGRTALLGGIAGVSELARRWQVSKQYAHNLAHRKGFPDPIAELSMGPVWALDDVRAWESDRQHAEAELLEEAE